MRNRSSGPEFPRLRPGGITTAHTPRMPRTGGPTAPAERSDDRHRRHRSSRGAPRRALMDRRPLPRIVLATAHGSFDRSPQPSAARTRSAKV